MTSLNSRTDNAQIYKTIIQNFSNRLNAEKLSFVLVDCLKESWNDNNLNYFSDSEKKQFVDCYSRLNIVSNELFKDKK